MERSRLLTRVGGIAATTLVALMFSGCGGVDSKPVDDGGQPPNGNLNADVGATPDGSATPDSGSTPDGASAPDGGIPPDGGVAPEIVVDAAAMTADEWAVLNPRGKVLGVTMGEAPVVTFELRNGKGFLIKGIGGFTSQSSTALKPGYPNLAFSVAKLIPEDPVTHAPSRWVSYIVTSMPTKTAAAAPSRPTSDSTGTLVDHGDGTYTYTFYRDITAAQAFLDGYTYTGDNLRADLGDVSYDPSLTHRLTIQFYGNARGTGTNTPDGLAVATAVPMNDPINVIYDFVPSRGTPVGPSDAERDVVSTTNCNSCHGKIGTTTPHGGRVDNRYCSVCHSDQRKYGYPEAAAGTTTTYAGDTRKIGGAAAGEMTAMVHRIHMGNLLDKTGYNYADILFNNLGYSMIDAGQRMCMKCHANAAQADSWNSKPSRLACGTCHDNVDFSGGGGHSAQATDQNCRLCHTSDKIKAYHYTANITPNNPVIQDGLVSFSYEIKSAVQAVSGGTVSIVFRILSDNGVQGGDKNPVTFVAPASGMKDPLTGFTGAPGFLLAWAKPQEGLAVPVDFNNLKEDGKSPAASNHQPFSVSIASLLDPDKAASDGTITGPDSKGYYTATIATAKSFPKDAKMRTVALQSYFTQVAGVDDPTARHAISVVKAAGTSADKPDAARRKSVDSGKCAACHEWLEGHGGSRVYEIQVCTLCHVPGLTTSGVGISDTALSTYYDAGLFTSSDKANLAYWTGIDFGVNPVTAGKTNVALNFPQVTNNLKDMIHGLHAGKDRTANPIKIVRDRTPSAITVINGAAIGFPGILSDCQSCHAYNGFSGVPDGTLASRDMAFIDGGNLTPADAKSALARLNNGDLMITPFTASCASCHDSPVAAVHMRQNGGQIDVTRDTLNSAGESCSVCHGAGAEFDPAKVHK